MNARDIEPEILARPLPPHSLEVRGAWICWRISTAPNPSTGYVRADRSLRGKRITLKAHRLFYEKIRGPIGYRLTLDHLCRNRACVNPWHMEPVTNRVNILRGVGPTAANARKAVCKHGHEFTRDNTYWRANGERQCRACQRQVEARRGVRTRTPADRERDRLRIRAKRALARRKT